MTFHTPVSSSTANAGHATWLKARAAARGTSAPRLRSTGTSAASVSWPPTQIVAARTCRKSRTVSQLTGSTALPRYRRLPGRRLPGRLFPGRLFRGRRSGRPARAGRLSLAENFTEEHSEKLRHADRDTAGQVAT